MTVRMKSVNPILINKYVNPTADPLLQVQNHPQVTKTIQPGASVLRELLSALEGDMSCSPSTHSQRPSSIKLFIATLATLFNHSLNAKGRTLANTRTTIESIPGHSTEWASVLIQQASTPLVVLRPPYSRSLYSSVVGHKNNEDVTRRVFLSFSI